MERAVSLHGGATPGGGSGAVADAIAGPLRSILAGSMASADGSLEDAGGEGERGGNPVPVPAMGMELAVHPIQGQVPAQMPHPPLSPMPRAVSSPRSEPSVLGTIVPHRRLECLGGTLGTDRSE